MSACTSNASAWSGSASSSPTSAYIGDTINYVFTLMNTGDTTLQVNSAKLTIDWGAVSTTRDLTGTVALAPGTSGQLTCSFKVPEVAANIYTVTISINGKAVGDLFAGTKTYTNVLTIKVVPPLTVSVTSAKTSGQAPMTVNLDATPSGGVKEFTYHWTFGDGSTSSLQSPSYTYTKGGTYTATCLVTDSKGQTASDSITVSVTGNPTDITDTSSGGGGSAINSTFIILIVAAVIVAAVILFLVVRKK
ncbi:MAG: PKD domain-containing protein [Methanomassiliicoccus sp.]|nr:PKD domain-containing protein [Methanomassiliicoccus sp.]